MMSKYGTQSSVFGCLLPILTFFVHSQSISTTILAPAMPLQACSQDASVYRLRFTLDSSAFTLMNSKTVTLRLEFPTNYRFSSNITTMPIQWNGINAPFQAGTTSNPIITLSISPANLQNVNTLTIFASNCLLTPFKVGINTLTATFSWTGGSPLVSTSSIQTAAPIFKVIPSVLTPISSSTSCLDLTIITTCSFFASSTSVSLSDQRSILVLPDSVKVNGTLLSTIDASPSVLTLSNLGTILTGQNSSFAISICSVPTPRSVGTYCGLQLVMSAAGADLASTTFCISAARPGDFKTLSIEGNRYPVMQIHNLLVKASTGLEVQANDSIEIRLSPDFALGRTLLLANTGADVSLSVLVNNKKLSVDVAFSQAVDNALVFKVSGLALGAGDSLSLDFASVKGASTQLVIGDAVRLSLSDADGKLVLASTAALSVTYFALALTPALSLMNPERGLLTTAALKLQLPDFLVQKTDLQLDLYLPAELNQFLRQTFPTNFSSQVIFQSNYSSGLGNALAFQYQPVTDSLGSLHYRLAPSSNSGLLFADANPILVFSFILPIDTTSRIADFYGSISYKAEPVALFTSKGPAITSPGLDSDVLVGFYSNGRLEIKLSANESLPSKCTLVLKSSSPALLAFKDPNSIKSCLEVSNVSNPNAECSQNLIYANGSISPNTIVVDPEKIVGSEIRLRDLLSGLNLPIGQPRRQFDVQIHNIDFKNSLMPSNFDMKMSLMLPSNGSNLTQSGREVTLRVTTPCPKGCTSCSTQNPGVCFECEDGIALQDKACWLPLSRYNTYLALRIVVNGMFIVFLGILGIHNYLAITATSQDSRFNLNFFTDDKIVLSFLVLLHTLGTICYSFVVGNYVMVGASVSGFLVHVLSNVSVYFWVWKMPTCNCFQIGINRKTSLYVLFVHFSGLFYHIRYKKALESLKNYEGFYKKETRGPNLRRISEQNRRFSLLGGISGEGIAHMFKFKVYEKCRSINIAVKLPLLVGQFVVCLLSVLEYLPQEAFYEIPLVVFLELGAYVFYIDYFPASKNQEERAPNNDNSNVSELDLIVDRLGHKLSSVDNGESSVQLISDLSQQDSQVAHVNEHLMEVSLDELESLNFQGPEGMEAAAQYYISKLESLFKSLN